MKKLNLKFFSILYVLPYGYIYDFYYINEILKFNIKNFSMIEFNEIYSGEIYEF